MEKLTQALVVILAAMILTVVLAWPVQVLWNTSLVPAIEGVNHITFWQALGINFLASILFNASKVTQNKD